MFQKFIVEFSEVFFIFKKIILLPQLRQFNFKEFFFLKQGLFELIIPWFDLARFRIKVSETVYLVLNLNAEVDNRL